MSFFLNLIAWLAIYCYFCGIENKKQIFNYNNEPQNNYFSSQHERCAQYGGADKKRGHLTADAR